MKRLVRLAIRIYPRQWRERYGAEFAALLDQLPGRPGDLLDILWHGLKLRWQPRIIAEFAASAAVAFLLVWGSAQSAGSHAAARLAEAAFTALGVPVLRDGNLLLLASHQLSVGYSSSAAWAFIVLALLAAAHGVLMEMRLASRLFFLLGLVPVTIIACSIRIVITGVLAEANNVGSLVTAFGWVSFLIGAVTMLQLFRHLASAIRSPHRRER